EGDGNGGRAGIAEPHGGFVLGIGQGQAGKTGDGETGIGDEALIFLRGINDDSVVKDIRIDGGIVQRVGGARRNGGEIRRCCVGRGFKSIGDDGGDKSVRGTGDEGIDQRDGLIGGSGVGGGLKAIGDGARDKSIGGIGNKRVYQGDGLISRRGV